MTDRHVVPIRLYATVFAALMLLLILTIAAAYIDLGPFNVPVALLIATMKAVLVALYFMHIRYSSRLTWLFAGSGLLWLVILFGLTLSDYLSRTWL